ncbi:hypothetical protein F1188_19815 [Roseospira marina]|uniref:Uncharacterized protein n=2 Tax=Roseospira marina TaxID=140057 RepID=A0A5M6I526_9PROT|nr:hypothetical protein [Roseospira marina]KAA5603263.1 hypothetical protein F1188_19815 [Roseospira marina]
MREDRSDNAEIGGDTQDGAEASDREGRRGPVSTLTIVTVLFFLGIGLILTGVWNYGELIVTASRGTSILMLGVAFIIALNVIAIVLMLVLLKTIHGRDD